MPSKKNKFLTFLFSLLPGAGEMYMGFMKRGLSVMMLFFGLFTVCIYFNLEPLLFLLPVIWCYSFFQVHHLNSMPIEELYYIQDDYIINMDEVDLGGIIKRFRGVIAAVLIFLGIDILFRSVANILGSLIPYQFRGYFYEITATITRIIPQLIIGFSIVLAGLYLIKGKKLELNVQEKEEEGFKQESENKEEPKIYKGEVIPTVMNNPTDTK